MESSERSDFSVSAPQVGVTKAIAHLDELIQLVLKGLPRSMPWQRKLRVHLSEVDRGIQVLRLTLSLRRRDDEIRGAVEAVTRELRVANAYVGTGRADMGTKLAVRLAVDLGAKVAVAAEGLGGT